jgi:hypothetical protein
MHSCGRDDTLEVNVEMRGRRTACTGTRSASIARNSTWLLAGRAPCRDAPAVGQSFADRLHGHETIDRWCGREGEASRCRGWKAACAVRAADRATCSSSSRCRATCRAARASERAIAGPLCKWRAGVVERSAMCWPLRERDGVRASLNHAARCVPCSTLVSTEHGVPTRPTPPPAGR